MSKEKKTSQILQSLAIFFSTFLLFSILFDYRIINPMIYDWLMSSGDTGSHLLGWFYFRSDDWSWPPGKINTLFWPETTTIGHTDSIPIMAFFFKIFSFCLPEDFQYFGIYLFLSYFLLAILAYVLFRKHAEAGRSTAFLGSLLVVLSPPLISRVSHIALNSHYLLLLVILIAVDFLKNENFRKTSGYFLILNFLAAMIHPYIWAMIFPFYGMFTLHYCAFYLYKKKNNNYLHPFLYFLGTLGGSLICLFLVGYFEGGHSLETYGFGFFNANFLTYFDPQDKSLFLPNLGSVDGQYEGYAYLGLGNILLLVGVFGYRFFIGRKQRKAPSSIFRILWVWGIACFLFSMANNYLFGPYSLFQWDTDVVILDKFFGIFRSSGRFAWPLYYVMICLSLLYFLKLKIKNINYLLLALVLIQIADLQPFWLRPPFSLVEKADPQVYSKKLNLSPGMFQGQLRNAFIVPPYTMAPQVPQELSFFPIHYYQYLRISNSFSSEGIRLNSGFTSRTTFQQVNRILEETIRHLNSPENGDLFLFNSSGFEYHKSKYPSLNHLRCQRDVDIILCSL